MVQRVHRAPLRVTRTPQLLPTRSRLGPQIDGHHWAENLPLAIDAFFDTDPGKHANFLQQYGLTAAHVPLLRLDKNNWHEPFSLA